MAGPGAFVVGDEEKREVEEVLTTGYLSRYGREDDPRFKRKVVQLEGAFAERIGVQYCLAVNSGTSALMASLVALGIRPGDEVLISGYCFIASLSAVIVLGGKPVLTEIDDSLTMDPEDVEKKITKKTKIIMPVHMLGNPCNMDRIAEIAQRHNLLVLEDCCQGLGGSYKGAMLGSIGKMGVFSLNIHKTINSGEGGLITTNNQQLYDRAFGYHDQGHLPLGLGVEIGRRSVIGIDLRMNELTGAFALGQLKKLNGILKHLRENKRKFKEAIVEGGIRDVEFRKINDPGECATLLTVLFKNRATAKRVAKALGTKTLSASGWHVYNNMEQILAYVGANGKQPYKKNMLPQTDGILERAINLSVGVVDPGLGADFGINILSDDQEIENKAAEFIRIVKPILSA
jgi:8-amino-3,8-dideoxy-alpha-D-manno-octulosonate transaminase